jgi:dCTP deaminase
MLCDRSIARYLAAGDIVIEPAPLQAALQPASVDLHLGPAFIGVENLNDEQVFQAGLPIAPATVYPPSPATVYINPGECVLGSTMERVTVPHFMVARVEGKSTWGRRFLMIHSTAGFIDPGFEGFITLELKNLSPAPLLLPVGGPIAQISFDLLDEPCERPYGTAGNHYQGQSGPTVPAW